MVREPDVHPGNTTYWSHLACFLHAGARPPYLLSRYPSITPYIRNTGHKGVATRVCPAVRHLAVYADLLQYLDKILTAYSRSIDAITKRTFDPLYFRSTPHFVRDVKLILDRVGDNILRQVPMSHFAV